MLPISGDDGTQWAQKQVAKNWVDLQQYYAPAGLSSGSLVHLAHAIF
jgi:hypothetical protein